MYEGSIVTKKSVSGPIDWSSFNESFPQASPIPFLEAAELVKAKQAIVPETIVVGKVYRRWPFYHDKTGKLHILLVILFVTRVKSTYNH